MKKVIAGISCLFLLAGLGLAQEDTSGVGSFLIVRITGHNKDVSYKVMSPQEYRTLSGEIAAEGRCWDKSMNAAEREWKADPEVSKKSFPRNAISPKRASVSQTLNDRAKADEKVAAIEKREADQVALDKKREDEKNQNKNRGVTRKPVAVERAEQSKQQLEDQRNQMMKKALELFESKLADAIAGQPLTTPKEAAAPAEPKVDKKTEKAEKKTKK